MGDRSDSSARHRSRAGKIGMHHNIYKCTKLQRRRIKSGLLARLSSILDGPGEPCRIGADRKADRVGEPCPDLDHARPRGSDVNRYLRKASARDPLVAAPEAIVERDLFATEEALHLRNV